MPEIEKKITNKVRSEQPAPSSGESDNKLNREQVELINELKHREVKHVDHIHKLEKVTFLNYSRNYNYAPCILLSRIDVREHAKLQKWHFCR